MPGVELSDLYHYDRKKAHRMLQLKVTYIPPAGPLYITWGETAQSKNQRPARGVKRRAGRDGHCPGMYLAIGQQHCIQLHSSRGHVGTRSPSWRCHGQIHGFSRCSGPGRASPSVAPQSAVLASPAASAMPFALRNIRCRVLRLFCSAGSSHLAHERPELF
jgi:hypothetical protein